MNRYSKALLVLFMLMAAAVFIIQREYFSELDKYRIVRELRVSLNRSGVSGEQVSVFLAGDVMLGRTVMTTALDKYNDPTYPFWKVAERMRGEDIVFVNLENPIVEGCPRHYEGLKFCADPAMAVGLEYAGVDVVNLANNHSRNYGEGGLEQTAGYLDEVGIKVTGLGELVVIEHAGMKFGFLGFDFLTYEPTDGNFDLVGKSDGQVDILIVGVHWGVEYQLSANNLQRSVARRLVEAGADVVVGHHPHWVQPFDYAQGKDGEMKPIYYSLGNFVFDQMWSEETRRGAVVELVFEGVELVDEVVSYIHMENWAQPGFVVANQ